MDARASFRYAGGEIGPPLTSGAPASKAFQVGGAEMHGFTAIFGVFIVPPRKVCAPSRLARPRACAPSR